MTIKGEPLSKRSAASNDLVQEKKGRFRKREILLLGSLCGVVACNYLGFGLARVICQGVLAASLGAPARDVYSKRAHVQT